MHKNMRNQSIFSFISFEETTGPYWNAFFSITEYPMILRPGIKPGDSGPTRYLQIVILDLWTFSCLFSFNIDIFIMYLIKVQWAFLFHTFVRSNHTYICEKYVSTIHKKNKKLYDYDWRNMGDFAAITFVS